MAEYISKQDVIDYLNGYLHSLGEDADTLFNRGQRRALTNSIQDILAVKVAEVQPVKHGRWITKAEDYYKAWQGSGRSWDDMPYFVTGLKFACSNCFEQFDVNAEGVEKWNGCPLCLARMDGEQND